MPDRFLRNYSQVISKLSRAAGLNKSRRTNFILESRITLCEHFFKSPAQTAQWNWSRRLERSEEQGWYVVSRLRDLGSYSRYLTATAGLKGEHGRQHLKQGAFAHRRRQAIRGVVSENRTTKRWVQRSEVVEGFVKEA
jgi:hypothetical protein